MDLKTGDRVQLVGTGPMMTIEFINYVDGIATCAFTGAYKSKKPVDLPLADLHKVKRFAMRAG